MVKRRKAHNRALLEALYKELNNAVNGDGLDASDFARIAALLGQTKAVLDRATACAEVAQ